jgi:RNA polymerase sigma factor (sigma-70 family)
MANSTLSPVVRYVRRVVLRHQAHEADDGELLARFVAGRDEVAFAALVRRYGPMVLGVCRRVTRHEQDAEDAFQATFLVLVRRAGHIALPHLLGNWLYGVALRTATRARWRAARRRARELPLPAGDSTPAACGSEPSDVREVLDEEVSGLPAKYRLPFVLCYVEGKTNDEAARLLGCPRGTVQSRLAWARDRLRSRLTRRGVTASAGAGAAWLSAQLATAAVPAALDAGAMRAAVAMASVAPGSAAVSGSVAELTKGVLQTMWLAKIKYTLVVLLSFNFLAWTGALAYQAWAGQQPAAGRDEPSIRRSPGDNARPSATRRTERQDRVRISTGGDRGQTLVGSGKLSTEELRVADFKEVSVSSALRVEITHGKSFKSAVTWDDNLVRYIEATKDGSRLRLTLTAGKSFESDTPPKAVITMPDLAKLELDGAAETTLRGFKSDEDFKARVLGASRLKGEMEAADVELIAGGASQLALRGKARTAKLRAEAASQLDLSEFTARGAEALLDQGARATVRVRSEREFKARLKGASALDGSVEAAKIDVTADNASQVRLKGKAKEARLLGKTASHLQLKDFVVEDAKVELSDASQASVHARANLEYVLGGASQLRYRGNPTIRAARTADASSASPVP